MRSTTIAHLVMLSTLSGAGTGLETADTSRDHIWSPAPGTSWQWQLTGSVNTSLNVDMYNIDLFDVPVTVISDLQNRGVAVICYFSAGSSEDWRPDASMIPNALQGLSNGWEGERWLDIRQLDLLKPIMESRLDLARTKGCDGVEPDNVDAYTNQSGFDITAEHQLDFTIWLATEAHRRGLSVGLKNNLEQVIELEPYFDWALNEQCNQYDECDALLPFIESGKAVFGVEYTGDAQRYCPEMNARDYDWLTKNKDLDASRTPCR